MMDRSYSRVSSCSRITKPCTTEYSPVKLTLSANFTRTQRDFDISLPLRRASMRQDILDIVARRTESRMSDARRSITVDDNPMYEDPRDMIGEKPAKPPRKRTMQGIAIASPRSSTKDGKTVLKEQKKKLTKKYEQLITSLMERCEENLMQLSQKDLQISKLKEKLKSVLEYNNMFAEENDQLKNQHETLVKYVEACKKIIKEEREKNRELEAKLEEKVKQYELPDRDHDTPTAIPLVEVCMSCSSRQIIVNQAREHNNRLQKDMQALKDVLYRLNVQLSRYQEKLRTALQANASDKNEQGYKVPDSKVDALDSLINASLGYKGSDTAHAEDGHYTKHNEPATSRTVDLCGLLSAQALAPLFDAYQENLQEKDSLILDYEKQFENMNKKSKQIVSENKSLSDRVKTLEDELAEVRQSHKKLIVEKGTADIEKATLVERAERAESKLKEVYELYEGKISSMMRDYETVHREYFTVKTALELSESKLAQVDAMRARTVPADMHERRLDHCKRLLEELKHQYAMEAERKDEHITKLQEQVRAVEEKYTKVTQEKDNMKVELEKALKNVRLYRKAAVIFRHRLRAAAARATRARASTKRSKNNNNEPLRQAMAALDNIKREIKAVKARAYTSLEELERRILEQERRASLAHAEYRRELERASLALEHKEAIIRSLIDKVADVEEVRLSQTNTHRLQGIISDSSLERDSKKEAKPGVKLVPGHGGYYQEKESKGSKKRSSDK